MISKNFTHLFVKAFLIIFIISFSFNSFCQYISTPPALNGTIAGGEYGSTIDGTNQKSNGSINTYMTWDASKLYIAVSGASVNDATIIYIDKDNLIPVNGGTNLNGVATGQLYDGTNFANLPFKADLVIYAKNGSFSYRTNIAGVWSPASSTNLLYSDNGLGNAGGVKELSIAWSVIGGLPSSFNFFSYNTSSGGSVYNQEPAANPGGNIGLTAMYERYYTVTSTANGSSTVPFSRDCFVFNNTVSESNIGALNVYDFTMNNTALSISRSAAGGDWTVNGTMNVSAGTIDFGSTVSASYGNTSINNISVTGGSLIFDQNTNPVFLSGNFNKSSGTFNCSGRQINFNGLNSQTWSSNSTETIDYFTISNSSANGISAMSNLNIGVPNKNSITMNVNSNFTVSNNAVININNNSIGTINGSIKNSGATVNVPNTAGIAATITVSSTGAYTHNMDGGSLPYFSWANGSTCQVTGWLSTTTLLQGLTQNFYNFIWNSPSQTANLNFAGNLSSILGDFTVNSTGSGSIQLTNTNNFTLNIAGNYNQAGGIVILSNSYGQPQVNIGTNLLRKNFNLNGGVLDFNSIGSGLFCIINLTGDFSHKGGTLTHSGAGSNGLFVFAGTGKQNITSLLPSNFIDYQVNNGSYDSLNTDLQLNNGTFKILPGGTLSCFTNKLIGTASTFNQAAGAVLKTGSLDATGALTAFAASGSIQTTTRLFNTGGYYEFNGSANQVTGDFATTFSSPNTNTIANLTIMNASPNNTPGVTLSAPLIISNQLSLQLGKLTPTATKTLSLTSSAFAIGGNSNSFIDGTVTVNLPSKILTGTFSFNLPTGSGTNFLPFSLIKPLTGTTGPSISIKAFASSSSGTTDGSLSALSNTEYWSATVNSGQLTKSAVQLGRSTISPYNTVAVSSTSNGTYTFMGGTSITSSTITSTNQSSTLGYFSLGTAMADPTITSVKANTLSGPVTTPDYSGYVGQTELITGSNFLSSGLTVTIDGTVVSYNYISPTQISIVVPSGIATDFLVVTNTGTTGFASVPFTFNGYISTQNGDWNTASTWLGGTVPPQYSTITIKDVVTLTSDAAYFPNYLTVVKSSGFLVMVPSSSAGAGLIVYNKLTNNGSISMINNCTITLGNGGVFDNGSTISPALASFNGFGNSYINFPGDGTAAGFGSILGTINLNNLILGARVAFSPNVTVGGYLQINSNGLVTTNAPYFANTSKLVYNNNTSPGLEWSSVVPGNPGYPNNIDIGQNANTTLDLSQIQDPLHPGSLIPATSPYAIAGQLKITYLGFVNFNTLTQPVTINGDLLMDPSSQLSLSTATGGNLILESDWDNKGTFIANNSAVIFNNVTKNQYFYPTVPTTFNILTVDKNTYSLTFGTCPNKEVSITNQLNVTSGNMDFNDKHVTLTSTASKTASITTIYGTINPANAKNLTVERYFPPHRCWRLVSVPLVSSYTINHEWQEGQVNTTSTNINNILNYGTHISGAQPGLGFDLTPRNNPSMKQYDNVNDAWVGVPNTNPTLLSAQSAYMLFVRGSRWVNLYGSPYGPSDYTVLRTNGSLLMGDQTYSFTTPNNRFTLIGNPYPCTIDFHKISKTAGLGDKFIVWDPSLTGIYGVGGFVTFTWNIGSGSYVSSVTPATPALGQYIQSGQAFMVQGSGSAEKIIISETSKVTNTTSTVFKPMTDNSQQVSIGLNSINTDGSLSLEDGTLAIYHDSYSNGLDNTDANKIKNFRENIYLVRGNDSFAIEARKTISENDTLFVGIDSYIKDYIFTIVPNNFDNSVSAYLSDKFSNLELPLKINDTTFYKFSVTSDPATQVPDRFKIIFKKLSTLPVTFTSISAILKNNNVEVIWNTENEMAIKNYEIQHSVDGIHFYPIGTVPAKNVSSNSLSYHFEDVNVQNGENFYRVKSIGFNNENLVSSIAKVLVNSDVEVISIYPNPVINNEINIHFSRFLKGNYNITLINPTGQEIISKSFSKQSEEGGVITLKANLAHAKYQIRITKPDGSTKPIGLLF